jgi:hypothetical protein
MKSYNKHIRSRKNISLFLGLVLLLACGCKRDIVPPFLRCDRVYSEDDMRGCAIAGYIENGQDYTSPSCNPMNNDEFVVVENRSLVKYNTSTKEKIILADNLGTILTPDWGASGWIVFSSGWKIWKVHEGGSGLAQITFGPREIWPEFNPEGTRIIYPRNMEYASIDLRKEESLRLDYKMMVIDLDGNPVDSFCRVLGDDPCYPWETSSWSSSNTFAAEKGPNNDLSVYGIAIYDSQGNELKVPYSVDPDKKHKDYPFIGDIEWHPTNGLIYFQDRRGIKSLDPESGKVKLLKKSCADEFYDSFSITANGNHIIAVKGESSTNKDECMITTERFIVRMKINGSGEERILIPPF